MGLNKAIDCLNEYGGAKVQSLALMRCFSHRFDRCNFYASLSQLFGDLSRARHSDSVLDELGHCHLVAIEDASDGNLLAVALGIKLGSSH